MKKLFVFVLVMSMVLSMTTVVFAEENTLVGERVERFVKEDKKEVQRGERLVALFEKFNPEKVNDLLALQSEHQAFHEMAQSERDAVKENVKETIMDLKAQVEAGTLTQEEVKSLIEAMRAENETTKEMIQGLLAGKKEEAEAIRSEIQLILQEVKNEISSETTNEENIKSLLDQMLVLLEKHLEMDYYYYNLVHASL